MSRPTRILSAALATASVLAIGGCGDDEEAAVPIGFSVEQWIVQADRFCSDGTQEAAALQAPTSPREYARDAAARADILSTVRDGIVTLGQPQNVEVSALAIYLEELGADAEAMTSAAAAAREGSAFTPLDASAGEAAAALGLAECETFAATIASPPQ